jgi:hypothetical protein
VTRKLFATIGPWYTERNGGYTRIIRIGRRLGDAGETGYLELVKSPSRRKRLARQRIAAAEAKEKSLKGDVRRRRTKQRGGGRIERRAGRGSKKGGTESTPSARKRGRVKTG